MKQDLKRQILMLGIATSISADLLKFRSLDGAVEGIKLQRKQKSYPQKAKKGRSKFSH